MSQSCVVSAGLDGPEAFEVDLEVHVSGGAGAIKIVGLPDRALSEARERVRSAVSGSGYAWPPGTITINLAPARRRKEEGSAFDLPIALAILAAHKPRVVDAEGLAETAALGELSLGGQVRAVRGVLIAAEALRLARGRRLKRLLVPAGSAPLAALAVGSDLPVYPVRELGEAIGLVNGTHDAPAQPPPGPDEWERLLSGDDEGLDLADVRGLHFAKQALLVAAAGGHHLLLVGPPGAGKSMLASRLPGILPPLTAAEVLELTRIHSLAGAAAERVITRRPFRAPHHSASQAALVGGGQAARPGEVSLAHRGVLFLDELPEFSRTSLEALREPLENQRITISRVRRATTWPCDFALVAAMNPCPCGYWGETRVVCRCSPAAAERYANRLSGPLLDRLDLRVRVPETPPAALLRPAAPGPGSRSAAWRARVLEARDRQLGRGPRLNARLSARELAAGPPLSDEAEQLIRRAAERGTLSARGLLKLQRVARTVADLEGHERVEGDDLSLALALRRDPRGSV